MQENNHQDRGWRRPRHSHQQHLENHCVLRKSIPLQSMDNVHVHVIDAVEILTHM